MYLYLYFSAEYSGVPIRGAFIESQCVCTSLCEPCPGDNIEILPWFGAENRVVLSNQVMRIHKKIKNRDARHFLPEHRAGTNAINTTTTAGTVRRLQKIAIRFNSIKQTSHSSSPRRRLFFSRVTRDVAPCPWASGGLARPLGRRALASRGRYLTLRVS